MEDRTFKTDHTVGMNASICDLAQESQPQPLPWDLWGFLSFFFFFLSLQRNVVCVVCCHSCLILFITCQAFSVRDTSGLQAGRSTTKLFIDLLVQCVNIFWFYRVFFLIPYSSTRHFFPLRLGFTCALCRLGSLKVLLIIVRLQDVTVLGHHEHGDEVNHGERQKLSLLTVLLEQTKYTKQSVHF